MIAITIYIYINTQRETEVGNMSTKISASKRKVGGRMEKVDTT